MKTKSLLAIVLFLLAGQALYATAPVITSFSPVKGPVGTLVTINGTNLGSPSAFSIGGKTAIVISNTGTVLVGMVMPGAVTGAVNITTAGGTAAGIKSFQVSATSYPLIQAGTPLIGSTSGAGAQQGTSVAISADGSTALVGAPRINSFGGPLGQEGLVWVYVKSGSSWVEQAVLTCAGAVTVQAGEGTSVALSADGNTAMIGGPGDYSNGGVWFFTRSGSTWTQQGPEISTSSSTTFFPREGTSCSISADGNTAVGGAIANDNNMGAAFIYVRNAGVWTVAEKLVGTGSAGFGPRQGASVAISADASTVVVGAIDDTPYGAVWVYSLVAGSYVQVGSKLVAGTPLAHDDQGNSVAVSADGGTILVGTGTNEAFVFNRNAGGGYTQSGGSITGTGYAGDGDDFGTSVSLSADGKTAVLGGFQNGANGTLNEPGGTWIFTINNGFNVVGGIGSPYKQQIGPVLGTGTGTTPYGQQGTAVAVSADGSTAITGGPFNNSSQGAAWIFNHPAGATLPQTITFSANGVTEYGWANYAPAATSTNSTIPITYTSSNTAVATITVNGLIHVVAPGNTTITASQAGNANYGAATPVAQSLTVFPAQLTITAGTYNKNYSKPNPVLKVTYMGFVSGDNASDLTTLPTVNTTATSSSAVGSYPTVPSGAVDPNYSIIYVNGAINVLPVPLKITAVNKARDYGLANPVLKVTYAGFVNGDGQVNLTVQPAINTTATMASPLGTYPIVASGAVDPNYTINYINGTLTINPGTLKITAVNKAKTTGAVNPALTVTYSGFKNGDTQADLITQPTITTTATTASPAGTYPITVSGAAAANYSIDYIDGILTVTDPALEIPLAEDGLNAPKVSSALSPNGDGINDVLTISNIAKYPDNKLVLIDKSGAKVFEQSAYDNVQKVFTGKSNITGKQAPAGTYFYMLQYHDNGILKSKTGYIVIKY